MDNRSFIPQNYPKSFIVFVLAALAGLVAGGIAFVGMWFEIALLEALGRYIFFASWGVGAVMFLIFLPRVWGGRYRDLPAKSWREQVW